MTRRNDLFRIVAHGSGCFIVWHGRNEITSFMDVRGAKVFLKKYVEGIAASLGEGEAFRIAKAASDDPGNLAGWDHGLEDVVGSEFPEPVAGTSVCPTCHRKKHPQGSCTHCGPKWLERCGKCGRPKNSCCC